MIRLCRLIRSTATVKAPADYYKLLEIDKSASEEQIKFAYYKISQLYHPSIAKTADAKDKFQLVNEAYVILSDPKSRRAYDLLHRIDPHTAVTPPREPEAKSKSAYQKSREEKDAEFKKKYNIDEFGRFKGGLPSKRNGIIRGTALEPPGKFFSHIQHQNQVDPDPDYQYVTPQVAQSFKKFHENDRQFRSYKWPWFRVEVDYETFNGKRFLKFLDIALLLALALYVVPSFLMNGHILYKKGLEAQYIAQHKKKQ